MGISNKYSNAKYRKHFYRRFLFFSLLFAVAIFTFIIIFNNAVSLKKSEMVTYKESGSIDYKIYLKENDFYDTPFLEKNMAYIASLIKRIDINYNYNFYVDKESNIDFKYSIIGNLKISSQNNSNTFFEKKYVLKELKTDEMINKNNFVINDDISIDYDYYNTLANKFKSMYAVSADSFLEVYLQVEEKNKDNNSYKLFNTNKILLKIPLSQQEVNINLDGENIDKENKVAVDTNIKIKSKFLLFISSICMLVIVILFIKIIIMTIKLFKILKYGYTPYEKYVNKILRCYDRIIVNVSTLIDPDSYNTIKVTNFQELVDVRDNVKEPINYYVMEEHKSCVFYLIHNNDLYLYLISEEDIKEEI